MTTTDGSSHDDNEVFLRGRLSADPLLRTLPSGAELCTFRLVVPRPEGERVRVDSIDCATTNARVRRTLTSCSAGDELEVCGSLHRRFWRGAAGPASRYEVTVSAVKARRAIRRPRTDA